MTDPAHRDSTDRVMRRIREAFAHLEPHVELDDMVKRATRRLHRTRAVTVGGVVLSHADLARAKRRDPEAVGRLYEAYAPALLRYFVAAVGDRRAAEDLTGTTMARAIEALPSFHAELDKFGGWLFGIARHDQHDHRRHLDRTTAEHPGKTAQVEEAPAPEDPAALEPSQVMAALDQLSPDQREVLLLRLAASLTVREAAQSLGKTTGAVKALQHRGLASLARQFE